MVKITEPIIDLFNTYNVHVYHNTLKWNILSSMGKIWSKYNTLSQVTCMTGQVVVECPLYKHLSLPSGIDVVIYTTYTLSRGSGTVGPMNLFFVGNVIT